MAGVAEAAVESQLDGAHDCVRVRGRKSAKPKTEEHEIESQHRRRSSAPRKMRKKESRGSQGHAAQATILDSIRSSLPADGERPAITTGCAMRMAPALCGVSALMYCRHKLAKTSRRSSLLLDQGGEFRKGENAVPAKRARYGGADAP